MLALLIAGAGLRSVDSMIQRSNELLISSQLNELILTVDIDRQSYNVGMDSRQTAKVEQDIVAIQRQAGMLREALRASADQHRLDQVDQAITDYRQSCAQLVSTRLTRDRSRDDGIKVGEAALTHFNELNKQYFEELEQIYDLHTMLDQVIELVVVSAEQGVSSSERAADFVD
jgi:hypothetical protein